MEINRRACLAAIGSLSTAAPLAALAQAPGPAERPRSEAFPAALPDRASFAEWPGTYFDSGTVHPISLGARTRIEQYLAARTAPGSGSSSPDSDRILGAFSRLINADPDEVAFVKSTTAAEHMIVDALGLFEGHPHIVTDTLHFFGSFPLYEGLADRGARVTWLRPRDGRIRLEDMERAITSDTRLVALSLVSTFNGFEHDLARICEMAHAKGALVYADIVHAAGCVPVDVRASGVDFAACSSYKWLMGDFGLGFVYARRESQARLKRKRFGYYGIASFESHVFPFDPPGERIADFTMKDDASGQFATGTFPHVTAVHLDHSLHHILELGVDRINAHSRRLTDRLKEELAGLGYQVATPRESRAPIVTCIMEDARSLAPRLQEAGIKISISRNRFRVTPSVFNDMDDVDHLLRAIGRAA